MNPKPTNIELYKAIKEYIKMKYNKRWNAYYSGLLVQYYKALGGEYTGNRKNSNLKRWYNEEWEDIGNKEYLVYRPTIKISKETPLTVSEIDPVNLKKQISLKQRIKGERNLPKFIEKIEKK